MTDEPLKTKVLLIEDDDRLAQLISEYLGNYEFAVEVVRRGDIAVAAVREHAPALVILDLMLPHLRRLKAERSFIVSADVNIAHKEADLKNWKGNQKNSGFLPEERAWMTRLTQEEAIVDTYRALHPDTTDECYTWWSNRGQAWAKNVGWRLDYQLATPDLASGARAASVHKAERFSDHAPLTIDYDWSL